MFGHQFSANVLALGAAMAFVLLGMVTREGAAQTRAKHPVLDHGIVAAQAAAYEKAVEPVMAMSEEEMLSWMPEKRGATFVRCPNCYKGIDSGNIEWSADRPDELSCSICGASVWPNEKWPENAIMEGKNSLGETVRYKAWYNEELDYYHCFTAYIAERKRRWLMKQLYDLGEAYSATGKEEYGRRVVLVLDKIAKVYPHYVVAIHGSNQNRYFRIWERQQPPYNWSAGKWGWHSPASEVPINMVLTYDLVYESEWWGKLSEERGYNVRERFENDFVRATVAAAQAYPSHISNYAAYIGNVARVGMVIGEPAYVHWAYRWLLENVNAGCFYDGMWHESPSYHYMTMGGLRRSFAYLKGYSDPPGYIDEEDGTRFDDLDVVAAVPFWEKVQHAPEVVDFPNGCSTPVHDTWSNERRSQPRVTTGSTILPGFGHASLGRGMGVHQMQAQLHFSGHHGHSHYDNLNLTVFAKEREMLSDIGYTWTNIRWWPGSTPSHNLVVVDRKEQGRGVTDGDLLSYFPDADGVAMVEADGVRGYNNLEDVSMYRRMLVLVPVSDENAYVVDVFRTHGGSMHDWLLHGSADDDMSATCSIPLTGMRDDLAEVVDSDRDNPEAGCRGYSLMREMSFADTEASFNVTFTYNDIPDTSVRTHVLGNAPARVFLGRSPSVRRAGVGSRGDNTKVLDFWMPQLVVRREAGDDEQLHSSFVAVEEPFRGSAFISSVEAIELTPSDQDTVGLRITCGETVDTIISTLDEPPYPERKTGNGMAMRGRLGMVRQIAGKTTGAWLFEGVSLIADGWSVKAETGSYGGEIVGATRQADGGEHDAFITEAELPEGKALHGVWMIVRHGNGFTHGYPIERVGKQDGKTVIVLSMDHGLKVEGQQTQEVYYPQRTMKGANSFVIPLAATMVRAN
jgi:hypothetical protein